MLMWCLC